MSFYYNITTLRYLFIKVLALGVNIILFKFYIKLLVSLLQYYSNIDVFSLCLIFLVVRRGEERRREKVRWQINPTARQQGVEECLLTCLKVCMKLHEFPIPSIEVMFRIFNRVGRNFTLQMHSILLFYTGWARLTKN